VAGPACLRAVSMACRIRLRSASARCGATDHLTGGVVGGARLPQAITVPGLSTEAST